MELLKLLDWVKREGQRVVIVLEGRDAAGKGGAGGDAARQHLQAQLR